MKKENWATDFLTNLAKIYADDVEVIEIIEDTINGYGDYVAYVHKMESLKPILIDNDRVEIREQEIFTPKTELASNIFGIYNQLHGQVNRLNQTRKNVAL